MATSFSDNLKRQLTTADTLQRLLIVNVVLFIVIRLVNSLTQLYNTPLLDFEFVSKWLAVPAAPLVLLTKPYVFSLGILAFAIQYALVVLDGTNFSRVPGFQEIIEHIHSWRN